VRAVSIDLARDADSACFQSKKHGGKNSSIEKCNGRWDRGEAEEKTEALRRRFSI
jgi:hypothetical protein